MISGAENGAKVIITVILALALLLVAALAGPVVLLVVALLLPLYLMLLWYLGKITPPIGIGATEPVDWCGSGNTAYVPDFPFGIDAQKACMQHDFCYETGYTPGGYEATKESCDNMFGINLNNDCVSQQGGDEFLCGLLADTYKWAVILLGKKAFTEARYGK